MRSVPSRLPQIDTVEKRLLLQTVRPKEIQIQLPRYSLREGRKYEIPPFLVNRQGVSVKWADKDWGPATKFIPAVLRESDNQNILIVDDDNVYPHTFVEDFDKQSKLLPEVALGTRGWNVTADALGTPVVYGDQLRDPRNVHILTGVGGILVKPRFCNKTQLVDYEQAPKEAFFVDDQWLSGNLARSGVTRKIIPVIGRYRAQTSKFLFDNYGLSDNENKNGMNKQVLLKWFKDFWETWQY